MISLFKFSITNKFLIIGSGFYTIFRYRVMEKDVSKGNLTFLARMPRKSRRYLVWGIWFITWLGLLAGLVDRVYYEYVVIFSALHALLFLFLVNFRIKEFPRTNPYCISNLGGCRDICPLYDDLNVYHYCRFSDKLISQLLSACTYDVSITDKQ